jgi:hypothetical protein
MDEQRLRARGFFVRAGTRPGVLLVCLLLAIAGSLLAGCGGATEVPATAAPTAIALATTPLPVEPTQTPTRASTPAEVVPTAIPLPTTAVPTGIAPSATASPLPATATSPPTDTPTVPSPVPPSDTPPPTATPTPEGGDVPRVLSFTVNPTTTENVGDRLTIRWRADGEAAELCPIQGRPVEGACQAVPLEGSTEFVTNAASMAYTGFGLRVTAGDASVWGTETVRLQCQNLRAWFFDDPPARCPEAAPQTSYAAGQYFEGGLMVWVEDPDDFYVFYAGEDAQGFQTFDWILDITLKPGASEANRVGEDPPPGLYEPVSGFGMVWRGEIEGVRSDVRERLGWATEPEFGFDTAYQCTTPVHPRLWSCFLRGPRGEVLSLYPDSTAQVRLLWEEW